MAKNPKSWKPVDEMLICPICRELLSEPIILPCKHEFCKPCLLRAVEHNRYECPICRHRISVWLRRHAKDLDKHINQEKWEFIKKDIQAVISNSQDSENTEGDSATELCPFEYVPHSADLSNEGEVHAWYLSQLKKMQQERASKQQAEEEASKAILEQLMQEEDAALKLREEEERATAALIHQMIVNKEIDPVEATPDRQNAFESSDSTKRNEKPQRTMNMAPSTSYVSPMQSQSSNATFNSSRLGKNKPKSKATSSCSKKTSSKLGASPSSTRKPERKITEFLYKLP